MISLRNSSRNSTDDFLLSTFISVKSRKTYAFQHDCPYLPIVTNEGNIRACKLYDRLGHKEIDIVPCTFNGIDRLVCIEKTSGKTLACSTIAKAISVICIEKTSEKTLAPIEKTLEKDHESRKTLSQRANKCP